MSRGVELTIPQTSWIIARMHKTAGTLHWPKYKAYRRIITIAVSINNLINKRRRKSGSLFTRNDRVADDGHNDGKR